MSNHFGRLTYDQCYINEETKRSTMIGDYNLYYGQSQHDNSCISLDGPRNNRNNNSSENSKNTLGERAEIESHLSNRDEPETKCCRNRSLDDKRKRISRNLQYNTQCNEYLNPQHSRLNQPIDNFRGLSTINLQVDYPIIDPQENVFYGHNNNMNDRFGSNTRLEAKDTYRKNLKC